jgi:hypothetical protein
VQAYHWVREGWYGRAWHLHDHDLRVATLRQNGGFLSRSYDLTFGDATWTLRTSGVLRKRVVLAGPSGWQIEARVRLDGAKGDGHPDGWRDWRLVNVWRFHYELHAKGKGIVATMKGDHGSYVSEVEPTLRDGVPLLALGLVVNFAIQDVQITTGSIAGGIASAMVGG